MGAQRFFVSSIGLTSLADLQAKYNGKAKEKLFTNTTEEIRPKEAYATSPENAKKPQIAGLARPTIRGLKLCGYSLWEFDSFILSNSVIPGWFYPNNGESGVQTLTVTQNTPLASMEILIKIRR